jgi:uncharacterized protein YqeY
MLEERINQDLKTALLGGDKLAVSTLRVVKSAILNVKVDQNTRDQNMPDNELVTILQKEAKNRQESADLYKQGGDNDRANQELAEKTIIQKYLPAQLGEDDIAKLVDAAIEANDVQAQSSMGEIIAKVRQQAAGQADGAVIARIVKDRLTR